MGLVMVGLTEIFVWVQLSYGAVFKPFPGLAVPTVEESVWEQRLFFFDVEEQFF